MRSNKMSIRRNKGNVNQPLFGFVASVDADETKGYVAWLERMALFNGLGVKVTL